MKLLPLNVRTVEDFEHVYGELSINKADEGAEGYVELLEPWNTRDTQIERLLHRFIEHALRSTINALLGLPLPPRISMIEALAHDRSDIDWKHNAPWLDFPV